MLSIEKEHKQYETKVEHFMTLLEQGVKVESEEVLAVEKAQKNLNYHLEEALVSVETMADHALETVVEDEKSALMSMMALSFVSIIIGIGLGYVMTPAITKPISCSGYRE